ncbi:MAG: ATP-dependent nuclease [Telluria sp.]
MKIHQIKLVDFRCFESAVIDLSNITVITGHNNSGKSSILTSVLLLQLGCGPTAADIRAGAESSEIRLKCSGIENTRGAAFSKPVDGIIELDLIAGTDRTSVGFSMRIDAETARLNLEQFSNSEPKHCLVPYLSKRKVQAYSEDVKVQHARTVTDMTYLAAKLARITNPTYPSHEAYKKGCEAILGFMLTAVPSQNGQTPGVFLPDGTTLTLNEMGEGVPNIVALLIELSTARNKIFVIEEPENDLHPASLKVLLELILTSAEHNQFIVSTHSNIVVQYLAANDSRLYYVDKTKLFPPTSTLRTIEETPAARMAILRELGYALSDFELWEGWLVLEESSAERIIRDFLIPYFAPGISTIRTLAANGVDDVEATFNDFHRLVRFTHLEQVYRGSTWVKVDGDTAGKSIVERLTAKYKTWETDRFSHFSRSQFEYYYPSNFNSQVEATLSIQDKAQKREAKRQLLETVVAWLKEDKERAKIALETSATEVIGFLKDIETCILNR